MGRTLSATSSAKSDQGGGEILKVLAVIPEGLSYESEIGHILCTLMTTKTMNNNKRAEV